MPSKLPLLDPETQALLSFGWIRLIDVVLLSVCGLVALAGFGLWLFGQPTSGQLMALALALCSVQLSWAIMLLYRACYFVLKMRAAVELLPDRAARLAVQFMTAGGGLAAPTPKQPVS